MDLSFDMFKPFIVFVFYSKYWGCEIRFYSKHGGFSIFYNLVI